ncbi:substrate-binding domain-containing protein [Nitriliruptoraceae bacterium ZYF776]|nr:substrate-binding domain-containing protein [Profundirhabdus halotolerans]
MRSTTGRIRMVAAAAAVSLVAAACGGGDGDDGSAADEDGYRVAYIARAQVDSFAAWLANEMQAEADEYDDISLDVYDGQADDERLNGMIENAIANNYDAIIVQANNDEAQRPYIEMITQAGIVTITTNPRVDDIEGASSVDANPYDQGAAAARAALEDVPEGAQVVVLNGPGGNFHSTARRDAWEQEFFAERPDVEIVAEDIANWNKDEAMTLMEDWVLSRGDIDAIISMNDNMAAGALEAVSGNPAYSDILAYGVDGTPEAVLLVRDGLMSATVLQSAGELAELNLRTVHDLLTGAETEVHVDVDAPLIDESNAEEYIEMYQEAGLLD